MKMLWFFVVVVSLQCQNESRSLAAKGAKTSSKAPNPFHKPIADDQVSIRFKCCNMMISSKHVQFSSLQFGNILWKSGTTFFILHGIHLTPRWTKCRSSSSFLAFDCPSHLHSIVTLEQPVLAFFSPWFNAHYGSSLRNKNDNYSVSKRHKSYLNSPKIN